MNAASKNAALKPRLFFVGVGNMGNPMAANLVKAGYDVTVREVTEEIAALSLHGSIATGLPAGISFIFSSWFRVLE
jgi:6-phosphogluconate dehydrogenase (decarboxylating)